MHAFRQWLRDDQGVSAVVVALLLIVFIGFTALVVDMGYAYSAKRQLQAAADAGALAGCQELILQASEADVLEMARVYAEEQNNTPPGDGLTMVPDAPDTEVGTNYVKVTVEKPMSLFFGRIFSSTDRMIRAQAKAQIAYLSGIRGIVPWALPVLHANRVTATLNGHTSELTLDSGTGLWTGSLPLPTGASGSGYPVAVTAYNGQTAYPDGTTDPLYHPNGVTEVLSPAAAVSIVASGAPLSDVSLSRYYAVSGVHTAVTLTVHATSKPVARFNGKNISTFSELSPGVWQVSLPVPSPPDLLTYLPVDIDVGTGVDKFTLNSAAVLVVRRSTHPIQDVSLTRYAAQAGDGGSVGIAVTLNDYVYGHEYELKVIGGGAEIGNFCALDLTTVKHTPNWLHPQHPSEYSLSGNVYYNYLEHPFPYTIHIGDTIWTEPGNLSGPQTEDALQARFVGNSMTFEGWENAGKKPGNSRIVYVPIMEKVQWTTGTTPLRVVSFAAFYVEPGSELKGSAIVGRFIKYLAPSDDTSDIPPDGLYIMTPRLVSDGIY